MTFAQKTAVVVIAILLGIGVTSAYAATSDHTARANTMAYVAVVDDIALNSVAVQAKQEVDLDKQVGYNALKVIVPWNSSEGEHLMNDQTRVCNASLAAAQDGMAFFMTLEPQTSDGQPGGVPLHPGAISSYATTVAAYVSVLATPACGGLTTVNIGICNEPNSGTFWQPQMNAAGQWVAPWAYARLLNAVYPVAKAKATALGIQVNVIGGELASSHNMLGFIAAMGKVQMDTFAWHPYGYNSSDGPQNVHPDGSIVGLNDFGQLTQALQSSLGYVPPIIASEYGVQTVIPPKTGQYTNAQSPASAGAVTEAQQLVQYVQAMNLAAADGLVGIFYFHLVDDPDLSKEWSSGLYYYSAWPATPVAKSSEPAFHLALCAMIGC